MAQPKKKQRLTTFLAYVSQETLDELDLLCRKGNYKSRAAFVRGILENYVEARLRGLESKDGVG